MIVKYSLSLDSDDDFRSGCRNVSHHYRKQSFSGLHSLGRSNYTITFYILPMQYEYFTRSENRSLLSQTPLGGGRQGETGGDRGRQGEAGGDRGWWDKCKTEFSLAPFPCDPRGSLAINDERFLGNIPAIFYGAQSLESILRFKMADEDEVEVRGIKRPLVENYSDDEEEEEARRKQGTASRPGRISTLEMMRKAKLLKIWLWSSCFSLIPPITDHDNYNPLHNYWNIPFFLRLSCLR